MEAQEVVWIAGALLTLAVLVIVGRALWVVWPPLLEQFTSDGSAGRLKDWAGGNVSHSAGEEVPGE